VSMRYHASVFAYMCGLPQLVVSYAKKSEAFAKDVGLVDDAVISVDDLLEGRLGERLHVLLQNPARFVAEFPLDKAREMAKSGIPIDMIQG